MQAMTQHSHHTLHNKYTTIAAGTTPPLAHAPRTSIARALVNVKFTSTEFQVVAIRRYSLANDDHLFGIVNDALALDGESLAHTLQEEGSARPCAPWFCPMLNRYTAPTQLASALA